MKTKLAIVTLLLGSRMLYADAANDLNEIDKVRERRQALEGREGNLRLKYRNLDVLNTFFARAKYLRDTAIGGNTGVIKTSEAWVNDVQSWISQWGTLTETLKSINPNNIDNSARTIESIVDDFFRKYTQYEASAAEIVQRLHAIDKELQSMQVLSGDAAPGYENYVRGFNTHRDNILQLNSTLLGSLQNDRVRLLGQSISVFRATVLGKIRLLLVTYPDLESVLVQTQKLLEMIDEQGEKVADLERSAVAARSALTAGSYFLAERQFAVVKSLEKDLKASITAEKFGARNADFYLGRIRLSVDTTQSQWDSTIGLQTRHTIFYKFFTSQRKTLSADCRNPELVRQRNCEVLRTLNQIKIDLPKVKSMKDEDLAFLEAKLIAVRENRG